MTNRSKQLQVRLLGTTIAASAIFAASPAFAQEQPGNQQVEPLTERTVQETSGQSGDTVVVTGTLIRNPNLVSSSPVTAVGEDEIDLQQANVAEELLRELPGAVPSIGSAVNNGNGGASYVNLRGLGSNRNITLLDGVRIVPADLQGRVDLNNIPLALIQRVDVLTGGASTTYGADAVSGVVNFITRQDFAGVDINLSSQISEDGDGHIFRSDVTLGANFDDGRGNAVLSLGYQEADPVFQGDRDYGANTISSFGGGLVGSGTSVPSRFSVPGQGTRQINPATGALVPTYATFNFNPFNVYQTPFERFNIYGAANYEVSEEIEIYTRGLFSKNTVQTIVAPSGAFGISVAIPVSNPFLPAAARATFCANNDFNPNLPGVQTLTPAQCAAAAAATNPQDPNYREFTTALFRRSTEIGARTSTYTTQVFDYRVGARGGITESIDWDLFGSYGESDNLQTIGGYSLNSRVRQSLRATNATTCLDTSNDCVPVNFFGPQGSISPAGAAFLNADSTVLTRTSLSQARGTISGDFGYSLPWASEPLSFAVGGEFREYTAQQASDQLAQSGDLGGAGGAAPNIRGGFDVWEAFGEVILPLVSDRPFFHELTLEAGARYSDYSVAAPGDPTFDTFTWKVGGSWAPVDSLRFRGNYARASRAPNIGELFSPVNTGLTNLANDPCASVDGSGADIGNRGPISGELAAVCLAQGATASNVQFIEQPIAGQANATGGGNLNLEPEQSESWTVGAVFQPNFIQGLSLTVDYYNIVVTGAITSPAPDDAIVACFGAPDTAGNYNPAAGSASSQACTQIRRDPQTGGLNGDPATTGGLFLATSNLGRLATSGVDFTFNYRRDIGFAGLAVSGVLNWTDESIFEAVEGVSGPRDCTGLYSANCASIQPEWQWSVRTTLTFADSIDVSLLWRHINAVEYEFFNNGNSGDNAFVGTIPSLGGRSFDFNQIEAYDYFDLGTRFAVTDNFTFSFLIQNLLDKDPPVVGNDIGSTLYNSGNTFPSTYDAVGRRFVASARLRF
jgi:iron complex outermembrane receptor protein